MRVPPRATPEIVLFASSAFVTLADGSESVVVTVRFGVVRAPVEEIVVVPV